MKKNLKITDADDISAIFQKVANKLPAIKDTDDTVINDEDEIIAVEDACCKDDEVVEEVETETSAEAPKTLKVTLENDNFDEEDIKELAAKNNCKVNEFNDEQIIFEGTNVDLTNLLKNDAFDMAEDDIADLMVNAAEVMDADEEDKEDEEVKEEAREEEAEPAKSEDSIFTPEEIQMIKQLASLAPDLIALVEKANDEEEAEEKAEDPGEELNAGEEDEDEEDEDEASMNEAIIANFDDEDEIVEDCDHVMHDSKAAFGSIERKNTTVADSIDDDLDLINLWNKRYGG